MRSLPSRFVAAMALALLVACTGPASAATVSETDIGVEELASAAKVFEAFSSLANAPCGQVQGDTDTEEAACNRFTLGVLIGFRAAEDYAAANGVEPITQADLEDTAEQIATNYGEGVLDDALEASGSTHEAFLEVLRASMLQQAAAASLVESTVSEDDLRAEYEANLVDHVIAQVDHILVKTEAEANDVYEQVTAPGATRDDFLALAAEVSKDPSVKTNGGSLASTPVSQFVPEFADAVLALENGDISRPVKTDFGWHVIHMVDKEVTPFADVRAGLVASKAGPAFADYERSLIEDGAIEVNPRFGRLDPATLTVVRITSTDPVGTASSPEPVNVAPGSG
jgi:hypothetical protein